MEIIKKLTGHFLNNYIAAASDTAPSRAGINLVSRIHFIRQDKKIFSKLDVDFFNLGNIKIPGGKSFDDLSSERTCFLEQVSVKPSPYFNRMCEISPIRKNIAEENILEDIGRDNFGYQFFVAPLPNDSQSIWLFLGVICKTDTKKNPFSDQSSFKRVKNKFRAVAALKKPYNVFSKKYKFNESIKAPRKLRISGNFFLFIEIYPFLDIQYIRNVYEFDPKGKTYTFLKTVTLPETTSTHRICRSYIFEVENRANNSRSHRHEIVVNEQKPEKDVERNFFVPDCQKIDYNTLHGVKHGTLPEALGRGFETNSYDQFHKTCSPQKSFSLNFSKPLSHIPVLSSSASGPTRSIEEKKAMPILYQSRGRVDVNNSYTGAPSFKDGECVVERNKSRNNISYDRASALNRSVVIKDLGENPKSLGVRSSSPIVEPRGEKVVYKEEIRDTGREGTSHNTERHHKYYDMRGGRQKDKISYFFPEKAPPVIKNEVLNDNHSIPGDIKEPPERMVNENLVENGDKNIKILDIVSEEKVSSIPNGFGAEKTSYCLKKETSHIHPAAIDSDYADGDELFKVCKKLDEPSTNIKKAEIFRPGTKKIVIEHRIGKNGINKSVPNVESRDAVGETTSLQPYEMEGSLHDEVYNEDSFVLVGGLSKSSENIKNLEKKLIECEEKISELLKRPIEPITSILKADSQDDVPSIPEGVVAEETFSQQDKITPNIDDKISNHDFSVLGRPGKSSEDIEYENILDEEGPFENDSILVILNSNSQGNVFTIPRGDVSDETFLHLDQIAANIDDKILNSDTSELKQPVKSPKNSERSKNIECEKIVDEESTLKNEVNTKIPSSNSRDDVFAFPQDDVAAMEASLYLDEITANVIDNVSVYEELAENKQNTGLCGKNRVESGKKVDADAIRKSEVNTSTLNVVREDKSSNITQNANPVEDLVYKNEEESKNNHEVLNKDFSDPKTSDEGSENPKRSEDGKATNGKKRTSKKKWVFIGCLIFILIILKLYIFRDYRRE